MDGTRFDALTRTLALGQTRRRMLGALTGVFAAALTASAGAATKRRRGEICRKDGECASGVCGPKDGSGRRRCAAGTGDSCTDPSECPNGDCLGGTCCTGADFCEGSFCCDPNRPPTATCCPDTGQCCECFFRQDPGDERTECCTSVCKSLTNSPTEDECCRGDEICINGGCCWTGQVCEDRCCATRCCNGACCVEGEECVVAPGASEESCQAVRSCSDDAQCNTAAGEVCATENNVCCPPERTFSQEVIVDGVSTFETTCCPLGQEANAELGCCPLPDVCRTTRGSFTRF